MAGRKRNGPPRSAVCKICGKPRIERETGQALCEEHQREYWRNSSRRSHAKQRALKAGEAYAPDEQPLLPPPSIAPSPRPARPLRPAPAPPLTPAPDVGEIEVRLSVRPRIVVVGDRVTMDLGMLRQISEPAAMATMGPPPRQLAVVSSDLARVLLYEAQARELHDLPEGVEGYAARLQKLRDAGYVICVEE
jgi:hypothetical protein